MTEYIWLIIPLIIASIGSLGAVGAAFAARRSAEETKRSAEEMRKAVLAQIVINILDAYGSPEMLEGMQKLLDWKKQHGPNWIEKFAELRRTNYSAIKPYDEARRRFSHHFHKIYTLMDTGVVDESFVKKLVNKGQVEFLLNNIVPLEEAIKLSYYDPSTFDTFRKMYPNISSEKN